MEQTTEQKRQAILEAVASGKVSAMDLEPQRRGATVSRLKAGKPMKTATIDRLFASLVAIQGSEPTIPAAGQVIEQAPVPVQAEQAQDAISILQAKIAELEAENAKLKWEIKSMAEQETEQTAQQKQAEQSLSERLAQVEQRLAQIEQTAQGQAQQPTATENSFPDVLGFRLTNKATRTAGKVYRKWYAVRGNVVVYVGNDPHRAEEKILAWQAKTSQ